MKPTLALKRTLIAIAIIEVILTVPFVFSGIIRVLGLDYEESLLNGLGNLDLDAIHELQKLDNIYFGWGTIFPSFSSTQLTYLFQFAISVISVIGLLWAIGRITKPEVYIAQLDGVGRSLIGVLLLFTYYFDNNEVITPFLMMVGWYMIGIGVIQYTLSQYRPKTAW